MNVTKAIVPVAGWGTRMLPITKTIEKSMLPVGTRPVIDYVVQDLIKADIKDIYFVVNNEQTQLKSYYSHNEPLEAYLEGKGKHEALKMVKPPEGVRFHYVVQPDDGRYGTSIPVSLFADEIDEDEQALVIMGDQFFYRTDEGSSAAELIEHVKEASADAGLLGVPVPKEDVSKYGIIAIDENNMFQHIVEKPAPEKAPSNLNNASFYLFPKQIFELAAELPANPARGEYEITDAINTFISRGGAMVVDEAVGTYLDAGNPQGWLHANSYVASAEAA